MQVCVGAGGVQSRLRQVHTDGPVQTTRKENSLGDNKNLIVATSSSIYLVTEFILVSKIKNIILIEGEKCMYQAKRANIFYLKVFFL